jgi:hypothetical protein
MKAILEKYKSRYHFSVNFYSLFLIATFIPDVAGVNKLIIKYAYWAVKLLLAFLVLRKDKRSVFRPTLAEGLFFLLVFIYAVRIFIDVFTYSAISIPKSEWSHAMGVMDFVGYCIGILIALSFSRILQLLLDITDHRVVPCLFPFFPDARDGCA